MSHKTLITSGCSFTQTELPSMNIKFNAWPQQLATKHNLNLINYGFFATGNSMIARTLIYGVSKFLKDGDDKHPSEEGHIKYTEQFIEPHLNARSLI